MGRVKFLGMNKYLPQIILPKEKTKLFMEWYKKDLYNEDNIPEVFSEGYLFIDLSEFIKIIPLSIFDLDSKKLALQKELIEEIKDRYNSAIMYFKFIGNNKLKLIAYSKNTKECIGRADEFDYSIIKQERFIQTIRMKISGNESLYKDVDEDLIINLKDLKDNSKYNLEEIKISSCNDVLNNFGSKWFNTCIYLLTSSFWYLTSIKDEKEKENLINRNYVDNIDCNYKNKKRHYRNRVRNITTPIYDLSNMKSLSINKLVARKKGWKISYEFSVRGHYRHYKSGKIVFIKPFEKGKGLEIKQNIIRLNPIERRK